MLELKTILTGLNVFFPFTENTIDDRRVSGSIKNKNYVLKKLNFQGFRSSYQLLKNYKLNFGRIFYCVIIEKQFKRIYTLSFSVTKSDYC